MSELEQIEKKIDNMLAREDMFEERYQKSKIENDTMNKWLAICLVCFVVAMFVGGILGYWSGYEVGVKEVMNKLLYQRLGIFV